MRLVWAVPALLALLLNVSGAIAQTVQWQPTQDTLSNHYPNPLPQGAYGPGGIVGAWNSAAFDTLRNQLIIAAAGGHGDYAGNEVYAYQHDKVPPGFVRLTDPTPCLTLPSAWNYPSGDYSCDGASIVSRHTYGGVTYEPLRDCVWMSGGVRWHDGNPTSMSWCFHLATNAWEQLGITMSGYFPGMALSFQSTGNPYVVWDAGGMGGAGCLMTANRWVYSCIDEVHNITVPVACSGVSQGPLGAYSGVIDPVLRTMYVLGGGHLRALDLSTSHLPIPAACNNGPFAQDVILATTGKTEIETLNINNPKIDGFAGTGFAWDPVGRVLVAYGETADKLNGRVYTLDPTTRVWMAWEATGTPPPHPTGTGVWNKLWFANDGCLYVLTDGNKPVYQACNLPWRGAPTYQVRVDTNGAGTVTGAGSYAAGTLVSLSASASAGSVFAGWSGNPLCATGSFTMPPAPVSCIATFTLVPLPTLTVLANGSGSVSGGGTYAIGQSVTVSAWPTNGWAFTGWTGDTACPASGTTTVTMPNVNVTCTANFVIIPICQGPVVPGTGVSWTPILRPVASSGVPHPDPAGSAILGGQMKHARFTYNSVTGESLLTGGDHGGSGPGGTVGDGNFQPTVWATRDGSSWRLLSPGCPAAGIYPARPDNVVWVADTKRNRGVIWPGFFGGIAKALSECANPNPQMDALLFDLASNAWGPVPWLPPNPPNPANSSQYWGDNGMTWGVYDPVNDSIYGYTWSGFWGGTLVGLDVTSGTWTKRNLGEQTATQPYNDDLRNSYAARMQPALDVQGRAFYFQGGFNKQLYRVRLDVSNHRGEWVSALPAQCVGRDDDSMEGYSVFDSDHRAVLIFCVPNLGGEVVGIAVYYVDTGKWAYVAAPTTLPYPVMANAFVYSPSCRCVIATGGHSIFTENPARPNPAPNPFTGTVPPGNQWLPDPRVDWQIKLLG